MAKIIAGTTVIAAAAVQPYIQHAQLPIYGVCESATDPGGVLPPTAVVVDFEDGTRTTYAVSAGVLLQADAPINASALGRTAAFQSPVPNPGSRVQGPVCVHIAVLDAAGVWSAPSDFLVVQTPLGFMTIPYVAAQFID